LNYSKKIAHIVGARPQFVKMAMIYKLCQQKLNQIIIHTGQHFDENMSDVFFKDLNLPQPEYNLNIHSLHRLDMLSKMQDSISSVLKIENPDILIVYGDTNSTLAGARVASRLNIKIVHIEAGLRSFNLNMPEELNRIETDQLSDILFCPTLTAVENLRKEKLYNKKIINCGDVMFDAIKKYNENIITDSDFNYILCTIHRQENTDSIDNLRAIFNGLNIIHSSIMPVLMPIHPRCKKAIEKAKITPFFDVIEPIGYLKMIEKLSNSKLVITDSGGLQKEAFFLQKPCLTIRDETEWIELLDVGVNELCVPILDDIVAKTSIMLNKKINFNHSFYGDGFAAKKIVQELLSI